MPLIRPTAPINEPFHNLKGPEMKIARQAALLLCLAALLIASWMAPLDAPAMQQVDAGLKRALVSFASARAVSGAISVLQGTQIDIMPAGLGATLAPGQVLAPINELVKHFSDLMLVASVSFGIQKVLISMSSYWAISLVLTVTAFGWATFLFRKRHPPAFLSKLLVVLLMLRFAVPVAALGSDLLAERFMASDYAGSQKALDTAMGKASKVPLPTPSVVVPTPVPAPTAPVSAPALPASAAPVNSGSRWKFHLPTMPSMPTMPTMTLSSLLSLPMPSIPDFSGRFEEMKAAAEQAAEHMIRIMGIFLLQTLVIPILLLWGLYGIAKAVFQLPRQWPNLTPNSRKVSNPTGSNDGLGS